METNLQNRLATVSAQRQVFYGLIIRNLKEKYVGSLLGVLWSLINPVLIMLAVAFVFTQVLKTEIPKFPLFVLSALLPWFFFSNSLSESTVSLFRSNDLLNRFVIAREIIPLSIVLANFLNFLLGFLLLLPVFALFNPAALQGFLFLPLVMILHIFFTAGISLFLSVGGAFLKDLSQILNVCLMFLFWVTPIFYPLNAVPQGYRGMIAANPAAHYVLIYRSLLYEGKLPGLGLWLPAAIFSLVFFAAGYAFFAAKETEVSKLI